MGYHTDWIGYLHVQPALNEHEIDLINRISGSIFAAAPEPGSEVAGRVGATRDLMVGAPPGHSNWSACPQGCCLSYDGGDKANHMATWLKFLLATFLVPGAIASGGGGFEWLTCDHFLNGMVVGSRRDNRELYSIAARENEVEVELLWPGVPEWSDYPPLRYQTEIDRFRDWVVEERLKEAKDRANQRRAETGMPTLYTS